MKGENVDPIRKPIDQINPSENNTAMSFGGSSDAAPKENTEMKAENEALKAENVELMAKLEAEKQQNVVLTEKVSQLELQISEAKLAEVEVAVEEKAEVVADA